MTNISDNEVLQKIIEFQSCIIEGKNIKSILHKNKDFFLNKSGSNIVTVYMHEHGNVNPEHILAKDREFEHLINKYVFSKKNFKWETFVANCDDHFAKGCSHERVTDMYQIFKGYMTKKDAEQFSRELNIKSAIIMPIYDYGNREIIGYCCFINQTEEEMKIENASMVKSSIEVLMRPLYDKKQNTIYSKCIRIDENMGMLTEKEKQIMKKVIVGISYVDIAENLNISINTIKTHMKNIFNKYAVNSRIELLNKFHIHYR
ncbi:hypothetical protein MNB_SV-5-167 [hydrothermal vent metagenome]|uniref:HTH luxR-type domain-containing protein n=1 Tax=hydrothermal vent metagenome TaxID=652676 RepID=A0A1W1ECR0_9ZZZZ